MQGAGPIGALRRGQDPIRYAGIGPEGSHAMILGSSLSIRYAYIIYNMDPHVEMFDLLQCFQHVAMY